MSKSEEEQESWEREAKPYFSWQPSKSLLASIRCYQKYKKKPHNPFAWAMRKLAVVKHRFWSIITGADIPLNSHIGGGLIMPHPNGIVIHPDAKIGVNCLIFQQVTIGNSAKKGVPTIGTHVDIGAGAKILGPVIIGDNARIGANAVVLGDVPAGKTAVGIPAKIID